MLTAQDVSYDEAHNLHTKWQKHQAFMAELAANKDWLDKVDKVSGGTVAAGREPRGLFCAGSWPRCREGSWHQAVVLPGLDLRASGAKPPKWRAMVWGTKVFGLRDGDSRTVGKYKLVAQEPNCSLGSTQ